MSEELQDPTTAQAQPAPNRGRGRGRGYHSDHAGRYMTRPREPHYTENYSRGGSYHENRGRGYHDNRGRGYHPQNRGRGHQFEHRGRGYKHHDTRAGGHHQEDEEDLIDPQQTLELLGVKDLRQHLEKLRLEQKNSNNLEGGDDFGDEPRSQHSPRGGGRGRGRSGSRSRGRSEDRGHSQQRRGDETQHEIYINDVYNIKVEMSTSTGRKTFKLDQEDRLSNLKHVPDYETEWEGYQTHQARPTEYHRGYTASRRGLGRGRGQNRGRGHMSHNYEYEPRTEGYDNTFAQGGEGYARRGRTRGHKNFDQTVRSRQFQRTRPPANDSWKSEESESLKEDALKKVNESVIDSEENWDLEIAEYEATQKQDDVPQSEGVDCPENSDGRAQESGEGQDAAVDQTKHHGDTEYYKGGELNEDYHDEHYEENYECEGHENYKYEDDENYDTYYAEECEGYIEENAEGTEDYNDSEFNSESNQQETDARATVVQNVDENNLQADVVVKQEETSQECDKTNTTGDVCIETQENNGNPVDEQHLPQTEDNNDLLSSVKNENKSEQSPKQTKKTKDKKKKVRINAP